MYKTNTGNVKLRAKFAQCPFLGISENGKTFDGGSLEREIEGKRKIENVMHVYIYIHTDGLMHRIDMMDRWIAMMDRWIAAGWLDRRREEARRYVKETERYRRCTCVCIYIYIDR